MIYQRAMGNLDSPSQQPFIKNFSPEDHVKVKANQWLIRPGDREAFAKEAKEVLGVYDPDVKGKIISWDDLSRFPSAPGYMPESAEGRERIQEFQADPKVAEELERYKNMFGEEASRARQLPAPVDQTGGYSPAVDKIIHDYFERMRKQREVKRGAEAVEDGIGEDGEPYIKIKFNRKIRDLPAAETQSSDDAEPSNDDTAVDSFSEAEDTREARIERVAREEERMKEARAAERRRRESQEIIQGAIAPIQDEMQEVKRMMEEQQKNIDNLSKDVHERSDEAPRVDPSSSSSMIMSNTGISFSIPGKIKMDRLELPGGRYDFAIGGPAVSKSAEEEDKAPVVSSNPVPDSDERAQVKQDDAGVLNSREDLDAGIDQDAVRNAARDLANSRIQSFDKSKQEATEDDVLDTVSMMDNAIDREAVKAAADELRDQVIQDHQPTAKAEDDVLDSTTGMDNGVDVKAVRKAAEQLQSRKIGMTSNSDDDVLDSMSMMDNAIDRKAVQNAAKALQDRVISSASPPADDVLDSVTGMDNGVDGKAVRQAADELQARLAGGKVVQAKTAGSTRKDAKLKGKGARTQMLSEEMLLPINMRGGYAGKYLDPVGGTAHRKELRTRASLEETEADRNHTEHLNGLMDQQEEQPAHEYQPSVVGGLGGAGSTQEAWYASWWKNPNSEDLVNSVDEDLGLTEDQGKQKLVENGLNVDGWEPGRSQEQVREDELHHHEVPAGFWSADMQENQDYDEDNEDDKQAGEGEEEGVGEGHQGAEHAEGEESQDEEQQEEKEEEPLWKDPMPKSVLCQGRNATWCQESEAGGQGGEEQGQEQEQGQ